MVAAHSLQPTGQSLYFAGSRFEGTEPWISDGTLEGTRRIHDIRTDTSHANPGGFHSVGDDLYFLAELRHITGTSSTSLWRFNNDGVDYFDSVGLPPVNNFWVDRPLALLGRDLYFSGSAFLGTTGQELWRLRGGVPSLVVDVYPGVDGSRPEWLTAVGEQLYFVAGQEFSSNSRPAIWRYDPATDSTVVVREGASNIFLGPRELTKGDGYLYFLAGFDLRRTDGTPEGEELIKSFEDLRDMEDIHSLMRVGSKLYFVVKQRHSPATLWVTDGTAEGTNPVIEMGFGHARETIDNLIEIDGQIFLTTLLDNDRLSQLWRSDGTEPGTQLLVGFDYDAEFDNFTNISGQLYFTASLDGKGTELWRLDAESGQPILVEEFWEGPQGSDPRDLTLHQGRLYVSATTPLYGREIYVANISPTGDFDRDLVVDIGDYTVWRDTLGSDSDLRADADDSGQVGADDFALWKSNFGADHVANEPSSNVAGDANNDGVVSGSDLLAVTNYFGATGIANGLLWGDADNDGSVSGSDLLAVTNNFSTTIASNTVITVTANTLTANEAAFAFPPVILSTAKSQAVSDLAIDAAVALPDDGTSLLRRNPGAQEQVDQSAAKAFDDAFREVEREHEEIEATLQGVSLEGQLR